MDTSSRIASGQGSSRFVWARSRTPAGRGALGDLPTGFGKWNPVCRRFRDRAVSGVFERIFNVLSDEPDMQVAMVNGTSVKVHRHGQGAKGGTRGQAIGRSRGGRTARTLALTDALGKLVRFALLPGHRFDSNRIIAGMNNRGAAICISQRPQRKPPPQIDPER